MYNTTELPVLGSEPSISQLYSTKAGARRLFQDAGVSLPPHEADIFSQEQFITCLSLQVANNLLIRRWLFKLPEQIQGRGFGKVCMFSLNRATFPIPISQHSVTSANT